MRSAIVQRAIQRHAAVKGGRVIPFRSAGDMRAGACGPSACPPGGTNASSLAAMNGRTLVGADGRCQESMLPLVNAAVGAGATATITATAQVALCTRSIIIVTTGTLGFTFTNLTIGNRPQLLIAGTYHSDVFAPDAECACCLEGDCVTVGTTVSVTVTNLDAGTARGFFMYLKGPAIY